MHRWIPRLLACVALLMSAAALAQSGPPVTFYTVPTYPAAQQPFTAVFGVYASEAALGIWGVHVSGREIEVGFDYGCGFICPGVGESYRYHEARIPPLEKGTYQVYFTSGGDPVATFPLEIGAIPPIPASVPATGTAATAILILLLFAFAWRQHITSRRS